MAEFMVNRHVAVITNIAARGIPRVGGMHPALIVGNHIIANVAVPYVITGVAIARHARRLGQHKRKSPAAFCIFETDAKTRPSPVVLERFFYLASKRGEVDPDCTIYRYLVLNRLSNRAAHSKVWYRKK